MGQQIVHNTGTNYSLYYNVLNYFKTIMSNHPSIAEVTQGDITKIDTTQFPAYPLGNILITETNLGSNIDINDDISCVAFAEEYENGLAGWVATFTLTTHNDRNRCLFFLINPCGSGYIIEDCITNDRYKAVLNGSGSIGQVFSAPYVFPNAQNITTSYGVNCYTIVDTFIGEDDFNLVNLPILNIPMPDFGDCPNCLRWIEPQVWGTTFQNWSSGPYVAYKTWSKA